MRFAGCSPTPKPGYYVTIEGTDNKVYSYQHLATIASGIHENASVATGQQIGEMGRSRTCTTNGGWPLHLHFERRDNVMNCTTACARDPYLGIRNAYARPGLRAPNGETVESTIYARWLTAVAQFPDEKTAMWFVGWPARGSNLASANAVQHTSSHGNNGRRQNLATGQNTFGTSDGTSGAITHRSADNSAFWVYGNFYKTWRQQNAQAGYLGWPISDFVDGASIDIQYFEGGCIYTYGGPYSHAPWGSAPCTF